MAEMNSHQRTALVGWIVVGWLLTLVVIFFWFMTDTITTVVFALGIGLGLGIAFIIVVNEALIMTTIHRVESRTFVSIFFVVFPFVIIFSPYSSDVHPIRCPC